MYTNDKGASDEVIYSCADIFCFHVNKIIMTIDNNAISTFPMQEKYKNSKYWFSTGSFFYIVEVLNMMLSW